MAFQVRVGYEKIVNTGNANITGGLELFTSNRLCGEKNANDGLVPMNSVYLRCTPNAIKGSIVTVQKTNGLTLQIEEVDLVILSDVTPGISTSVYLLYIGTRKKTGSLPYYTVHLF